MIHTYRDADAFENGFSAMGRMLVLPVVVIIALVLIGGRSPANLSPADAEGAGVMLLVLSLFLIRKSYRTCGEIRLSDDGNCELETKHRVLRLNVTEIRLVQCTQDDEDSSVEWYTLHYRGGKLRVTQRMAGFNDFLTRLKTLNPAVSLTGFHQWPDLRTPATEDPRTSVNGRVRAAFFPSLVIVVLVFLAYEALAGK